MLVPWWIMAAWAYTEGASPILSDACFDAIAERLTAEWDSVNHWHKALLDRASLKTSLAIKGKWPLRAMSAAQVLMTQETIRPELLDPLLW